MTTDLRRELDSLADTQPFSPDPAAWDRGRRARRRDRLARGAAVLAALAVVGGIGAAVVTDGDHEARTASGETVEGGAIPRRIEDIPADLDVSTGLAVGGGSVAFISQTRDPVVVTAADGVPHRLRLPGWTPDNQSVALSPDGERLAWQDRSSDGPATIGVLDLWSGRVRSYDVAPTAGLQLRELSWSPNGAWLAWIGDTEGGALVGRIRPASQLQSGGTSITGNVPSVAVSSSGTLVVSRGRGLFMVDDGNPPVRIARSAGGAGSFSPDGRYLALRSGPGDRSSTRDVAARKVVEHPFPADTLGPSVVLPLGWVDDRLQLLQVWSEAGGAELVVTTPEVNETSTWRRSVGAIAPEIAGRVSVAVDLVPDLDGTSSQQLTHDFGDTTPGERDISWLIGLGVAAAIAVLLGLRRLWRRFSLG
jgi:hypothetical protein